MADTMTPTLFAASPPRRTRASAWPTPFAPDNGARFYRHRLAERRVCADAYGRGPVTSQGVVVAYAMPLDEGDYARALNAPERFVCTRRDAPYFDQSHALALCRFSSDGYRADGYRADGFVVVYGEYEHDDVPPRLMRVDLGWDALCALRKATNAALREYRERTHAAILTGRALVDAGEFLDATLNLRQTLDRMDTRGRAQASTDRERPERLYLCPNGRTVYVATYADGGAGPLERLDVIDMHRSTARTRERYTRTVFARGYPHAWSHTEETDPALWTTPEIFWNRHRPACLPALDLA